MKRFSLLLAALMLVAGCSTTLDVNRTALQDVAGGAAVVDLYLYGRGSLTDPMKIAIMDIATDDFSFHLMAPASMYRVIRAIDAEQAASIAEEFVGGKGTCVATVQASSILSENGRLIGYEFRGIYNIPLWGVVDPVISSYWMRTTESVGVNVSAADPNLGGIHCTRS